MSSASPSTPLDPRTHVHEAFVLPVVDGRVSASDIVLDALRQQPAPPGVAPIVGARVAEDAVVIEQRVPVDAAPLPAVATASAAESLALLARLAASVAALHRVDRWHGAVHRGAVRRRPNGEVVLVGWNPRGSVAGDIADLARLAVELLPPASVHATLASLLVRAADPDPDVRPPMSRIAEALATEAQAARADRPSAAVLPDTVLPDTVLPDTVLPDTVLPDTVLPATVPPDPVPLGPALPPVPLPVPRSAAVRRRPPWTDRAPAGSVGESGRRSPGRHAARSRSRSGAGSASRPGRPAGSSIRVAARASRSALARIGIVGGAGAFLAMLAVRAIG